MYPRAILKKIYWAGFLFSFHAALTVYVNSSFLATKIPESLVATLYTASAIVSVIGLFIVPRLIAKFGSRITLGTILVINVLNIVGLMFSSNLLVIALCFILFFGFNTTLYLGLDILIEHFSNDSIQGSIRGAYLTANSLGFMTAPLIAGYVVDRLGFGTLYGFALIMLLPVIYIICMRTRDVRQAHRSKIYIMPIIQKFFKNRNLRSVFLTNSILQFFYVWMTIYTPLYLHEVVGIAWDDIGIMFTVMLSAFVMFQYIIGKVADRFHCEKILMMVGLLIMGSATLFVAQAPLYSLVTLTGILFLTRVGASIVEVSTESYFFKHVHPDDVGSIGFFRNTYPFASIVATLLGALLLQVIPLSQLFTVLGILCIVGIMIAQGIRQTQNTP